MWRRCCFQPWGSKKFSAGPAAERAPWVRFCGSAIQKFSSTFFKRWRVPRAAPLAAIRRWRNAPYFRRIWGSGGLCKRKAPRTFPVSLTQRVGASPWGRWRKAPEGALPGRWGFFSWGGACFAFLPMPPPRGEVARRAGEGTTDFSLGLPPPPLSRCGGSSPVGELGPNGEAGFSTEKLVESGKPRRAAPIRALRGRFRPKKL